VGCGYGTDWLVWTVTVLWVLNGLVGFDGKCTVRCACGTDTLCWKVTMLWAVGVERIG
jgi:hypothetical protein